MEGRDGPGGYRDPVAQWPTDRCSPSGVAVLAGRAWLAALQGSLWFGTSNRDGRGSPAAADDRIFRVAL